MDIQTSLATAISTFSADVQKIGVQLAIAELQKLHGNGAAPRAARAPKVATNGDAVAAAPKTNGKTRRRKGEKRDPSAVEDIMNKVEAAVKAAPESGVEAIGKALGLKTKEMALPIKKLLAAKRIKSRGQKRATKYRV